jgi:hypothetical protein
MVTVAEFPITLAPEVEKVPPLIFRVPVARVMLFATLMVPAFTKVVPAQLWFTLI